MKKISNTRMFIEYILIMFCGYLLGSGIVAFIGDYSFRAVLCSEYQLIPCIFVYWWLPGPRMADIEGYNEGK